MRCFVVYSDDGDSVDKVFSDRAAAERYAGGDAYVHEHEVWDGDPPAWTYWHRGADVYPDGEVFDCEKEYTATGEVSIPPVDDHLNRRDEPWDGHTQGHCGEHVSIFGTDRAAVEIAFQEAVARAKERQTGICQSKYSNHQGDIDGRTVYEAGMSGLRRNGVREIEHPECLWRFEHEWEPPTANGNRFCRHCTMMLMSFTVTSR